MLIQRGKSLFCTQTGSAQLQVFVSPPTYNTCWKSASQMIIFLVIASWPLNPLCPLCFQLRGSHPLNVCTPPSTSLLVTSSITLNLAGSATRLPPSPHQGHSCHAVLQAADHVRDVTSQLLCTPPAAPQLPDCSCRIHVSPTFISDFSLPLQGTNSHRQLK